MAGLSTFWSHFYPRPPRGGRLQCMIDFVKLFQFLSTPSARRATSSCLLSILSCTISIHALREEGDARTGRHETAQADFYPRPPRGGRPVQAATRRQINDISIHALREEGDAQDVQSYDRSTISIHALREEGDLVSCCTRRGVMSFLSTPSARRATLVYDPELKTTQFLSTPSARRATGIARVQVWSK